LVNCSKENLATLPATLIFFLFTHQKIVFRRLMKFVLRANGVRFVGPEIIRGQFYVRKLQRRRCKNLVQGQFVARPNVACPNVAHPNVAFLNVARPNVTRPNVIPRGRMSPLGASNRTYYT
jgi:hypothetical protein